MGVIIKNGIVYSPSDYLNINGGEMSGAIIRRNSSENISADVIRFEKGGNKNAVIGTRTPTGMTGNIFFDVACGAAGSGHSRAFSVNGYDSDKFSVRFGSADFGFIEQKTFDLAKSETYSGTLVSKPYVVLIFPVVGNSGSGATTTENNPVYTATGMTSTGFTFKNLTDFTKFRYVALGVPSDYVF